ncbi:MAG: sulfatase-like hydrolase/transferase [Polyangiaceae bacterium]|nr:sulfatase-like hydrolase/transferase [Polyangiaceae bacterium]
MACSQSPQSHSRTTAGTANSGPSSVAATHDDAAAAEGALSRPGSSASPNETTIIDFLKVGSSCVFGHRGILLDLGDRTTQTRMSGTKMTPHDVEIREREGATWVAARSRSLALSFTAPPDIPSDAGVVIEARVRGGIAKKASFSLNGKLLGSPMLAKGETKTVKIRAPNATIPRGENELVIRLHGGTRGSHDVLAEIDWIRIGTIDDDSPYAAPTRGDAIATASIGGLAYRSVSLRAPGFTQCTEFIPSGAMLKAKIGVTGGEADAEVRVLVDRAEPRVVGSFHLGGEAAPAWWPVALKLVDLDTIAAVELVAKSSTKGARVVFGEPRVVVPAAPRVPPPAVSRGVVVVVLGSVSPSTLALYGGTLPMTELTELGSSGTIFDAHRAPTSFASSSVASMLTGLSPREHGMQSAGAVLPPSVLTVAQAARQAGIVTAMFTANPTTSSAFGFARGWETFIARMPNEEASATAVFDDAAQWLDDHKTDRFLVFVHARGGHPPWDLPAEELKELPPADYAGALDPKRAGEMLYKARHTAGQARIFADADRERAFALEGRAVLAHDAALGRLLSRAKGLGRNADTTWIVTGDVGIDPAARVPMLEDDTLDEASLSLPLVVKSPESPNAPRAPRVASPTTSIDIARTVLEAFGLSPPTELRAESLWSLAHRPPTDTMRAMRPLLATTSTRYSLRWGSFVFAAFMGHEAKLCNLSLDAACLSDLRPTHPLAADVMHALVFEELSAQKGAEPAHPNPGAINPGALRAWGR